MLLACLPVCIVLHVFFECKFNITIDYVVRKLKATTFPACFEFRYVRQFIQWRKGSQPVVTVAFVSLKVGERTSKTCLPHSKLVT